MAKHNGVWSPVYGQVWTHPKTAKAAAWACENVKKVTPATAPSLIVGWLNRLNLWCLANSHSGSLAGLPTARVGTVAWPEAVENGMAALKAGEAVLGALGAGGFLDPGPAVHDFDDVHAPILNRRGMNLDPQHQREAGLRSAAARRDRLGTAQPNRSRTDSEPVPEPMVEPVAPNRPRTDQPEPIAEPMPNPLTVTVTEPNQTTHSVSITETPCGFTTTPSSPQVEPPPTGRSPRLDAGPGLPAAADAPVQPLDMASVAHTLELRLGCSYQQASKAVQAAQAAGATLEWLRERAMAAAPPEAPWAWKDAAAEAWSKRGAKPWVPFLGRASKPVGVK